MSRGQGVVGAVLSTLVAVLVLAGPASAQAPVPSSTTTPRPPTASVVTDTAVAFVPVEAGTGTDALLGGPDLRGNDRPTLAERFPSGAYSIDNTLGAFDVTDKTVNAMAGGVFAITVWVARAVTRLLAWTFETDLLAGTADAVDDVVGRLGASVYAPFVEMMIVLAGAFVLGQLLRQRATRAFEGVMWSVLALSTGAAFLSHPGSLVRVANTTSVGLARGVMSALALADPGAPPPDGARTQATFSGDQATTELRIASDRFFRTFVFMPWQVMEFGSVSAGSRPCDPRRGDAPCAERLLEAKSASLLPGQPDDYAAIKDELAHGPDREAWEWYQGHRAAERLGVAVLALVAALFAGGLLLVVCSAVLVAQLGFLILILLAPLFLLLAVHPGAGRVVALRWAELTLACLIRRVAYATVVGVLMVASGVLVAATARAGTGAWFPTMAVQALLVAAVLAYRRPLTDLLSHVGGGGLALPERHVEYRARRVVSFAAGALVGRHGLRRALTGAGGPGGVRPRLNSQSLAPPERGPDAREALISEPAPAPGEEATS